MGYYISGGARKLKSYAFFSGCIFLHFIDGRTPPTGDDRSAGAWALRVHLEGTFAGTITHVSENQCTGFTNTALISHLTDLFLSIFVSFFLIV